MRMTGHDSETRTVRVSQFREGRASGELCQDGTFWAVVKLGEDALRAYSKADLLDLATLVSEMCLPLEVEG